MCECEAFNAETNQWETHPLSKYSKLRADPKYVTVVAEIDRDE